MSASLRSAAPVGARQPVPGPGRWRVSQRGCAAHGRGGRLNCHGVSESAERARMAVGPEWLSRPVLLGRGRRPGTRLGRRRGVSGLVAVCVLALGVAACSVRDAKAEASASASREAALTPELRAKRDAALSEPAPAKPPQLNEESAEGAAASVGYFLDLYRYAFMTGKTKEVDSMSENGCVFCKSVIDRANQLHKDGGWADKWDQDITNVRYYDKLEGYDYSRIEATINYGEMTSYSGGSWEKSVAPPTEGQKVRFAIRYVNGGWAIREGEVLQ